ncbi:MAG: alpha/beta fold hydrolase [Ferruginibacter sp.]
MNFNRKKIFNWIKVAIIIYCSIGIALYYLQGNFLFHPKKLETDYQFKFDVPFQEASIAINKEDTISLVKFLTTDSVKKGIVLYFHGNMDNIERYAHFALDFTRYGYEVWMQDYPGFGKSRGLRTEKKLYEQALEVYKMAAAKFEGDSIIIYGKSFGTGIAAYTASVTTCKRLIMETPYFSIPDLFNSYSWIYPTGYMSEYKIPTYKYLQEVAEPITIFHGTDDGVIFYRCAKKLQKYIKPGDEFITIQGGKHNDLAQKTEFQEHLRSLLLKF